MNPRHHGHEIPLERQFKLEELRRYLVGNPHEAQIIAVECYEDYLRSLAENLQLKAQLQKSTKRLELFPC
jgi:predicted secreted protein